MIKIKLFPKIIGFFENKDYKKTQKNLVNICYDINKVTNSGGNNWISKTYNTSGTKNLYNITDFHILLNWIDKKILEYCEELKISIKIKEKNAWFNIYKKNDYQEYHTHPNSKISAIYYLKGEKESSKTYFTDFNFSNIKFDIKEYTEENSYEWSVPFSEGVLLVFRSDLLHCVEKHNLDSDRISIAINYS